MNYLVVSGLEVAYTGVSAVQGFELEVARGEAVALLGPSGSGKSSVLRAIAGYLRPRAGSIRLGGRDLTKASARERNIGMVFQDYALFPHLRVEENVAFGLRARRIPRQEIRARVEQILDTVDLVGMGRRYPRELSGGQQQRVALARAIVIQPAVLLMDEPMGALDARLRESMQSYVRGIQRQLGITTIYVTHDPAEAYAMSDRIVLMRAGRIVATGPTHAVYTEPPNSFAARFLTSCTLLPIESGGLGQGLPGHRRPLRLVRPASGVAARTYALLKPESILCAEQTSAGSSEGLVTARLLAGPSFLVTVEAEGAVFTAHDLTGSLREGNRVHVSWRAADARVLEEDEEERPVAPAGQALEEVAAARGAGVGEAPA